MLRQHAADSVLRTGGEASLLRAYPAARNLRVRIDTRDKAMSTAATMLEVQWQEVRTNLSAFISRRVRRQADVDDLVQRVLLQIALSLDSLREPERLYAWVYRVARNVIVDYYRSSVVRHEVPSGNAEDLSPLGDLSEQASAEADTGAVQELATCLAPLINHLPAAFQDAIRMTELEGVTQAEAAKRSGLSLSGMKSRVQRARRQLREVVEACCRIELDRQGSISSYAPRRACACVGCT